MHSTSPTQLMQAPAMDVAAAGAVAPVVALRDVRKVHG
ncbi:MAG: hypothetical protein QOI62_1745, partial [Solirubrobacteraceae bacterium]|nr:hypothetical protein [Solirubrobacteraceae bacterium]